MAGRTLAGWFRPTYNIPCWLETALSVSSFHSSFHFIFFCFKRILISIKIAQIHMNARAEIWVSFDCHICFLACPYCPESEDSYGQRLSIYQHKFSLLVSSGNAQESVQQQMGIKTIHLLFILSFKVIHKACNKGRNSDLEGWVYCARA